MMRAVNRVIVAVLLAGGACAQTPEQQKFYEAEHAQELAAQKAKDAQLLQARAARRADPMTWVRSLDSLSDGGWQLRMVAGDGSSAAYSTDHQLKRSHDLVTVWLREEYAEPRQSGSGDTYLSSVHKVQYDCAKDHSRTLLDIYYTDNNLRGTQQVEEANDDKDTIWTPIVPGTSAELDYKWACGAVSAKAHK